MIENKRVVKKIPFISNEIKQPSLVRPRNIARLILVLSVLCLTTFYCGYCLAYITALGTNNIALVYGKFSQNAVVKAFLIAILAFGVTIGTLISPFFIPLGSRRNLTLILCLIAQVLEGIIQVEYLSVFFIIRVAQGIVTGLFLALIPIYIRQLSPKQINKKGLLGIMGPLFVVIGFMMSFGINTILLKSKINQFIRWRVVVSINFFAILTILIFILTGFIPESPNSLIQKNQMEEAKKVIGMFHQQKFIEEVFKQKVKQIQDAKIPPQPPSKNRPLIHTILAFQVPIMHQLTGVNAYISQMGFVTSVFNDDFGLYVPFLMGAVQLITAFISINYFYRVNRAILVLLGNLGMSICCLGLGICFLLIDQNENHAIFWTVVGLIVLMMAIHGATLIPAVWMYVPTVATKAEIRWSQVTNWFTCALSVVLFIVIGQLVGYAGIFLGFGGSTFLCFILNAKYMLKKKQNLKQIVNFQLKNLDFSKSSSQDYQNQNEDATAQKQLF